MKFVLFCHSLISDWNHGNAHFLRGICSELLARGHALRVLEPRDAWSVTHLSAEHGVEPIQRFHETYPDLRSIRFERESIDLDRALDRTDVVIVHEWNEPALVASVGEHAPASCRVLFHDTHHRSVSAPDEMARYDLRGYDGVLAFGEAVRRASARIRVRSTGPRSSSAVRRAGTRLSASSARAATAPAYRHRGVR